MCGLKTALFRSCTSVLFRTVFFRSCTPKVALPGSCTPNRCAKPSRSRPAVLTIGECNSPAGAAFGVQLRKSSSPHPTATPIGIGVRKPLSASTRVGQQRAVSDPLTFSSSAGAASGRRHRQERVGVCLLFCRPCCRRTNEDFDTRKTHSL